MAILIGCEESQVLCSEFRSAGYKAYSCDLQPTRGCKEWHIQGDVMDAVKSRWWTRIILHPDCTALAVCGNKTYAKGNDGYQARLDAIDWTMALWELSKEHSDEIILENPASVIFPHLRKAGAVIQYIQPYQFGHPEQKKTGLALHNVAPLVETDNVYNEMMLLPKNKRERVHYMPPSETRARDRSETYLGIAKAIVSQT
jgi:hypothetical protein